MGSLVHGIATDRRKLIAAVALVLVLAGFLRLYHIGWSFSDNGIDEGIMLERSLMVGRGLSLYAQVPSDQAPLAFIIGGMLDGRLLDLRLVVAGLSLVAIGACMLAARKTRGEVAMLATGLMLAVDFAFLRESRLFSLDLLSAAFLAMAILPLMAYLRGGGRVALAFSGILIGLSASSKLLAVVPLLGLLVFILIENRQQGVSRRKLTDILVLAASSAVPMALFLAWLGPSDMINGMVFDQGHRGADFALKLSILGYFGLNLGYLLPLAKLGKLWRSGPESRALLCMSLVTLAFMIFQPLTFFHHLVLLSPMFAILAGVVVSDSIGTKEGDCKQESPHKCEKKARPRISPILAIALAGIVVSTGLASYGLEVQERSVQYAYADLIRAHSAPDDYVIAGEPTMASLADRMTPPSVVNVAYRIYPDLTLETLEAAIQQSNVTVVVVCYRLNDIQGLPEYLGSQGFALLEVQSEPDQKPVLSLFEEGLGPIAFYYRTG